MRGHRHYTLSLHVGYRQTKPHIGWMLLENFYLNYRCSNFLAPGVLFGANGQPGSMAIGNILMLLMKWPTAQGGNAFSFPHLGHYQSGPPTLLHCANEMYSFMSPVLSPLKPVHSLHFYIFPEDDS